MTREVLENWCIKIEPQVIPLRLLVLLHIDVDVGRCIRHLDTMRFAALKHLLDHFVSACLSLD